MPGRDVGAVVSRTIAVFMVVRGLSVCAMLLTSISTPDSLALMWNVLPQAGIYLFSGLVLWVLASKFWPSDNPCSTDPGFNAEQWLRLALLVLGIYFLMKSLPEAVFSLLRAGGFAHRILDPLPRIDGPTILQALLASVLVLVGSMGLRSKGRARE